MAESQQVFFPGRSVAKGRVIARVSSEQAGWQHLNMVVLHLTRGQTFDITIEDNEYLAVVLSGVCNIRTNRENFDRVGRRRDVFDGLPYAVYLPRQTEFVIEAVSETVEIASCWSPTTQDHAMRLITPVDIQPQLRGGGQTSYQINPIVSTSDLTHRLAVYEAYTPGGNWAFYPPQAYTQPNTDKPVELAMLHRQRRPHGYALQHIYTQDGDLNQVIQTTNNDITILPHGYQTLCVAPGHTAYNLVFTASEGATQYTITEEKRQAWVKQTWVNQDPRLPLVDHGLEP